MPSFLPKNPVFSFAECLAVHLPQHLLTGLTSFSETRTLSKRTKEIWFVNPGSLLIQIRYLASHLPRKVRGSRAILRAHMQGPQKDLCPARVSWRLKSCRPLGSANLYCDRCGFVLGFRTRGEDTYSNSLQSQGEMHTEYEIAHQSVWIRCLIGLGWNWSEKNSTTLQALTISQGSDPNLLASILETSFPLSAATPDAPSVCHRTLISYALLSFWGLVHNMALGKAYTSP